MYRIPWNLPETIQTSWKSVRHKKKKKETQSDIKVQNMTQTKHKQDDKKND